MPPVVPDPTPGGTPGRVDGPGTATTVRAVRFRVFHTGARRGPGRRWVRRTESAVVLVFTGVTVAQIFWGVLSGVPVGTVPGPDTPGGTVPAAGELGSPGTVPGDVGTVPAAEEGEPPGTVPGDGDGGGGSGALGLLEDLVVAPAGSLAGYDRELFPHWDDSDGDGCDTRCEILARDRRPDGTWVSVWDGEVVDDPGRLHIDHVVALAEAWRSGADRWTTARRDLFADYEANLVVATAEVNRAKSDHDPGGWMPPDRSAVCLWVRTVVEVKHAWGLTVDPVERDVLARTLAGCPDD